MDRAQRKGRIVRVTAEHIAQFRKMRAIWIPVEAGAPYVSPKVPKIAFPLHREAVLRLPIFLSAGAMTPDATISQDQITLLGRLHIGLEDRELPVNVKRPYGDMTAYERDIAYILKIPPEGPNGELSEEQSQQLWKLHESLEGALQIWLKRAELAPGDYEEDADGRWSRVETPGDRIVLTRLAGRPDAKELFKAIEKRDLTEARRLLEHSADPLAEDREGFTPMGYAIAHNNLDAIKLLLQTGMDVDAPQGQARVTALIQAACAGALDIFSYLLKQGADLSARSLYQTTPLGFAVLYSNDEIVKAILQTGWTEPGGLGVAKPLAQTGSVSGAVVGNVGSKSTADILDLRPGDVIVEIDGAPIGQFADLVTALEGKKFGEKIRLVFIRDAKRQEVHSTLGPRIGEPCYKYEWPK